MAATGGHAAELPDDRVRDDAPSADAEIRRLNRLHRGIVGPGYSARDPALSMWVHATLVDSTIAVYDAWLEPLSRARRAAFYAETRPIGRAFGVPEDVLPADIDAFEGYLAAMLAPGGPVRVSAVARELAGVVLRPPLGAVGAGPRVGPAGGVRVDAVAVGRAAAGERARRVRAARGVSASERCRAGWSAGWRAWRPLLPAGFRQMPKALAADRRMRIVRFPLHGTWAGLSGPDEPDSPARSTAARRMAHRQIPTVSAPRPD